MSYLENFHGHYFFKQALVPKTSLSKNFVPCALPNYHLSIFQEAYLCWMVLGRIRLLVTKDNKK